MTLALLIVAAAGVYWAAQTSLRTGESPWRWPAPAAKLPPQIVTGPLLAYEGIPGVFAFGMTPATLRRSLGAPLITATPTTVAKRIGREVEGRDLVGGVFAWVGYTPEHTVTEITFAFHALEKLYHCQQRLLLVCRGKTLSLHGRLTKADVCALLKANALSYVNETEDLFTDGDPTQVGFHFDDDGTLSYVWLVIE
jgi:hypothetical protein